MSLICLGIFPKTLLWNPLLPAGSDVVAVVLVEVELVVVAVCVMVDVVTSAVVVFAVVVFAAVVVSESPLPQIKEQPVRKSPATAITDSVRSVVIAKSSDKEILFILIISNCNSRINTFIQVAD
jgi:hypothetical protein